MAGGIYHGRLVADGNGNLLADEGPDSGQPVAYIEGSYVFLQPGEPSHNDRHHERFAEMSGTQSEDPDAPGYAGSSPDDAPVGMEHHWEISEDDPNYDPNSPTGVRLRSLPDAQSARISGHTEGYSG